MNHFTLTFDENIQTEFRKEIAGIIDHFAWIVPRWLQSIHVNMYTEENEDARTTISVGVMYAYRSASLHFRDSWLNQRTEFKCEQVLHELIHLHLAILADYAREQINLLCPASESPKFNASLIGELTTRHEAATQDLSHLIFELYGPRDKSGGNN